MNLNTTKIDGKLKLTKGKVLVSELEFGIIKKGNIIIPDDDSTERGIRSRWAQVYLTAHDVTDLKKGDYVLLKHGRWTRRMNLEIDGQLTHLWMIDYPDAVIVKTQKRPEQLDQIQKTF